MELPRGLRGRVSSCIAGLRRAASWLGVHENGPVSRHGMRAGGRVAWTVAYESEAAGAPYLGFQRTILPTSLDRFSRRARSTT